MKLSELALDCKQWLALQGRSPQTLAQYAIIHGQFVAFLLEQQGLTNDVRHFTPEMVRAFMVHCHEKGVKPNTIRSKLSALSTLARIGMDRRDGRGRALLATDPTRSVQWPRQQQTETKYLYLEELRAFMAVSRQANEMLARDLFIETGLRVSELCRATWGDVVKTAEGGILRVTVKSRTARAEPREIPLSVATAGLLLAYKRTQKPPDPTPLLVDRRGKPWTRTGLSQLMVRIGQAAGITRFKVSAHKLRHTANVIARQAGLDPTVRARLLNHASPATLKRYDHLMPGETARAREVTAAYLKHVLERDYVRPGERASSDGAN